MMKKMLIALLICGLLLAGAGAIVYAQTDQSPVCPPENNVTEILGMTAGEIRDAYRDGKTMKDLFDAQGLDYDAFISEMTENSLACVIDALANGDITEEQASRLKESIQNNADNGFLFNLKNRIVKNFRGNRLKISSLDALASILGMDEADLLDAFKNGSTFAQIAEQQNMDPAAVFDEWVNKQIDDINQAVDAGTMESERADLLIEKLNEKLSNGFDFENWTLFDDIPGPHMKIRFLAGKDLFATVLDALGMTSDEFRAAIKDGQTLEDLATEKEIDLDTLYQTWIEDQINTVNEKLTNEEITQKQADSLLEKLNSQLSESFPTDLLRRTYRGFQNFRENRSLRLRRFGGFLGKGFPDSSLNPAETDPGVSF